MDENTFQRGTIVWNTVRETRGRLSIFSKLRSFDPKPIVNGTAVGILVASFVATIFRGNEEWLFLIAIASALTAFYDAVVVSLIVVVGTAVGTIITAPLDSLDNMEVLSGLGDLGLGIVLITGIWRSAVEESLFGFIRPIIIFIETFLVVGILRGTVEWIVIGGSIVGTATALIWTIFESKRKDLTARNDRGLPHYTMSAFHVRQLEVRRAESIVRDIFCDYLVLTSHGCSVRFSADHNSCRGRIDQFTMFGDGMCPPNYIPITRMIDIRVSYRREREIGVVLDTLFVAEDEKLGVGICILEIRPGHDRWNCFATTRLFGDGKVRFESTKINHVIAVVENSDFHLLRYRVKSILYSDNLNNFHLQFFNFHPLVEHDLKRDMAKRGYKILFAPRGVQTTTNGEIKAILKTHPSDEFEFKPEPTIKFEINDDFRNSFHERQFHLTLQARNPLLPSSLFVETTVEVNGTQQRHGLKQYCWKVQAPAEEAVTQKTHIENVNVGGDLFAGCSGTRVDNRRFNPGKEDGYSSEETEDMSNEN